MCLLNNWNRRQARQPSPNSPVRARDDEKRVGVKSPASLPSKCQNFIDSSFTAGFRAFEAIPALVNCRIMPNLELGFPMTHDARVTVNQHSECKDATELAVAPPTPPQLQARKLRVI